MKKTCYVLFLLFTITVLNAQLSGNLQVPGSYTSLASAITAINQQGVSGSLTVNIAAGYTETVPAGGYSLTVSGSPASPVVFRKAGVGANPLLIAYSGGSGTPGSMQQDGLWRLVGCDYVTIDGIDLLDPNTANPATMEFGFGFFKASATNGCQHNVIRNCTITLNRVNNANGSGPAADGSRGIDVVNALAGVHNSSITVSSVSGSHSYNSFYANTIRNCNIGVSLLGFTDVAPYTLADKGNDVGGTSALTGNIIQDFGGGGNQNAAAAVRTFAQYDLNISFNTINNNTGSGVNHPFLLRGIHLNAAAGANCTVNNNTLTLHGGATGSQLSVIENLAGSGAATNTVSICGNVIRDCSYKTSVSGPFYGIWNTASADVLLIKANRFLNNSTAAASGSTYLIYNNGAVASLVSIESNSLSFAYSGAAAYTGNMQSIYNANGTTATTVTVSGNLFSNYDHLGFAGTGNLYFIHHTSDSYQATISNNTWNNLILHHSGAQYLIHNNSATQASLSVTSNSIAGTFNRVAAAGATYLYYSTGASPSLCVQTISGNNFSNINGLFLGTGNFYGLYDADGATAPYPGKTVSNNVLSNIQINSSGNFYGYFLDQLGDGATGAGSAVYGNTLSGVSRAGIVYGLYVSGTVSPTYAPTVYGNTIQDLGSSGSSSAVYGVYLGGGGAGLHFHKNKISNISGSGSSATAHGIYIASAASTTLSNNLVGNVYAPNSSASNAVNGIYINGGTLVHVWHNSILLNAVSSGGNFNSNALYCSSTTSLGLRNNILVNLSTGGSGTAAAFRRSSTSLTNYLGNSGNNLFYAGTPAPTQVLLQNGTSAYQTLAAFQTAVAPRESNSVSQSVNFSSTVAVSPNFLKIVSNQVSAAESGASAITGVPEDFNSQVRHGHPGYSGSGSAPDIGAYEYDQNLNPCSGANAGTLSVLSHTLCAGQTVQLFSGGYTQGTGITHQWQVAIAPAGTYSNVAAAASPELILQQPTAGTYYYKLVTTCANVPVSSSSAEATVVVQPVPLVSAAANASLICAGKTLSLTATTITNAMYQWIGPAGFNTTTQNPVIPVQASGAYSLSVSLNGCNSAPVPVSVSVSHLTVSLLPVPPEICLGSPATLSLSSSGTSYTWSTGANTNTISVSPTVSTTYSVSVTNTANCVVSKEVTVAVINPSISANHTLLCGNTANAVLSVNAFTPASVNWYSTQTSATSIGAGTAYTLAITSSTLLYAEAINTLSGCQSQRVPVTVTLVPNPSLTVSAGPATVCPGNTSTLTAGGATTYTWAGIGTGSVRTVAPLSAQVYTVHGKDANGCTGTHTIGVATHTVPVLFTSQTATSVCPPTVVQFTASGADAYYWNTGANGPVTTVTPAVNSTYTVYGLNAEGCTGTKTLSVVLKGLPVVSIRQSTQVVCPGEIVTFTASGAVSYTWLPGNSVSITFTAQPFVSSVYNAIGKGINSCTQVAVAMVQVEACTGMEESVSAGDLKVFPNPSSGAFSISSEMFPLIKVSVFSALGEIVFESREANFLTHIDLQKQGKGIYFLRVETTNANFCKKVVVQ